MKLVSSMKDCIIKWMVIGIGILSIIFIICMDFHAIGKSPNIILKGETLISLCPNETYQEQGYQALDFNQQDITKQVKIKKYHDKWIYRVQNKKGNQATAIRKFVREDTDAPIITLEGNAEETIYIDTLYIEPGYHALDHCDVDLTSEVKQTGEVNTSVVGIYPIQYQVTDHAGNQTEAIRTVTVIPKPEITDKTIYLTFDDGPSYTITPGILQILKEENIQATFFVINHSDDLNYLIKQAYEDGHTIGIHSYSHNYRYIYTSEDNFYNDLLQMSNKIENITGQKTKIIRFPGGSSNTVSTFNPGIMTRLTSFVHEKGYFYFDWNISSGDAGEVKSAEEVYQNVVQNLGNHANLVLMHDFENNYYTLNALRRIIAYGKANGYTFLKLTEGSPTMHHKIYN